MSTNEKSCFSKNDYGQFPNYAYWREHGGIWADEYNRRKLTQPYYHIQEIMLVDYFLHNSPGKVLEFGCGPGRHLRNLSGIPGIDVYGFDQSPTMVEGCIHWTDKKWIDEHISLGQPIGKLPYPDRCFDIVFTAEVLVHVRPEDLSGILTELIRVC